MNYSALIQNRKSTREFTDKEVTLSQLETIRSYYQKSARALVPEIRTELYFYGPGTGAALEGAAGYNQFLVGAPQYMVLLSEQHPQAGLNAGYMMQDLLLKLSDMDLDSCWVTFFDSEDIKSVLGIVSHKEVAAIAAFGYGKKAVRRLRLNLRSMSNVDVVAKHRYMEPKRSVEDMAFLDTWGNTDGLDKYLGFFDDMLWESIYAASLAPSYLNRQAYGFLLKDGEISLVERPDQYNNRLDGDLSLGAVLLHFSAVAENWAGQLNWRFGLDTAQPELPEGYSVIATCSL
jgi:nitroreductase